MIMRSLNEINWKYFKNWITGRDPSFNPEKYLILIQEFANNCFIATFSYLTGNANIISNHKFIELDNTRLAYEILSNFKINNIQSINKNYLILVGSDLAISTKGNNNPFAVYSYQCRLFCFLSNRNLAFFVSKILYHIKKLTYQNFKRL